MAANRVGKTESGAYEATCHATGIYPHWWKGRRFPGPTEGWACGTTAETCRDIVQKALLGGVSEMGSGMIPRHLILDVKPRPHGLKDAKEQILVRHASGGVSVIGLKSYEQGRKSFEGTAKHWIWDDEEPPSDVYSEQTMRTATVRGILWLTFTPLQGMSEVVKGFVEPEKGKEKWYVQAGWKDAPHIPEDEKEELIRTTLPHELKARTEGEPSLGIGAIYPIAEDRIVCKEMVIPDSWPRSYGMDVGWNWTAVVWGARNPSTNTTYMYADYLGEQEAPAVHAAAVRAKGEWIEGAIDPAANGRSQVDGQKLMDIYRRLGLKLIKADNAVSSGLKVCWEGLVDGTIKVMPSCENWLREFRKYHRDTKGAIVKANDHLMDAWRYRMVSGRAIERVMLTRITAPPTEAGGGERGWMA
ncbi:MAG TPA: terminase family protein [Acidobacteriaceae bacterium]|nr:terminase family protein [Acidobacteriaceae bacterium]